MSIRLLAKELYLARKDVERVEQRLETAPMDQRKRIEDELRKASAQMRQLQRALDGQIGR